MENKLKYAVNKWALNNIKVIYQHSTKAVFSAESDFFGSAILKINAEPLLLKSEYEMLAKLCGERSCKVYAFEEGSGVMLEERILPGTVLREEKSLEKRILAFSKVFRAIHIPVESGATYLDWLKHICEWCEGKQAERNITEKAELARKFCTELFEKYPDRVLLHGDLHHDNLLLRTDGSYAMIDPKGVVGPAILDLPRFIMNEIDEKLIEGNDKEHIANVIRFCSEEFSYPLRDVQKAVVMEIILGNVWCVEDGENMNEQQMEIVEEVLEKIEKR